MKKSTQTVWTAQDASELLTRDGVGRFYVHSFFASREKLGELRSAINDALGINEPPAGATEPIMEPEDKERQLLKRIEDQRSMIGVALFHLMHDDGESARRCLQVALPDQKEDK